MALALSSNSLTNRTDSCGRCSTGKSLPISVVANDEPACEDRGVTTTGTSRGTPLEKRICTAVSIGRARPTNDDLNLARADDAGGIQRYGARFTSALQAHGRVGQPMSTAVDECPGQNQDHHAA